MARHPWTFAIFGLAAVLGAGAAGAETFELQFAPRPTPVQPASPPPPPPSELPVQLILDDDLPDGATGVNGNTARQFLWLQRFDGPGEAFDLAQIWVLFPAGANIAPGGDVQLVVYADDDGDPANGADLLATYDRTIQAADGDTFSIYDLDPPLAVGDVPDVLIGVVDRFVTSGVTSLTFPAAVDTSSSAGRSAVVLWSGDPPDPPALPSDGSFIPVNGNWMLRGFGRLAPVPVIEVPALGGAGLALLAVLLAAAGCWRTVRRSRR